MSKLRRNQASESSGIITVELLIRLGQVTGSLGLLRIRKPEGDHNFAGEACSPLGAKVGVERG